MINFVAKTLVFIKKLPFRGQNISGKTSQKSGKNAWKKQLKYLFFFFLLSSSTIRLPGVDTNPNGGAEFGAGGTRAFQGAAMVTLQIFGATGRVGVQNHLIGRSGTVHARVLANGRPVWLLSAPTCSCRFFWKCCCQNALVFLTDLDTYSKRTH